MMREPSLVALNAVTAGMDLVAIAMALAFTQAWGVPGPGWLLLPPMWVATGLLARFALAVPLVAVAEPLASGSPPATTGGPVQPWVYAVVYPGFAGMGVGLVLAFVQYARRRWSPLFESTAGPPGPGATHAVQAPLAVASALTAAALAVLHLAWALGATVGLGREVAARRVVSPSVVIV